MTDDGAWDDDVWSRREPHPWDHLPTGGSRSLRRVGWVPGSADFNSGMRWSDPTPVRSLAEPLPSPVEHRSVPVEEHLAWLARQGRKRSTP